MKFKLNSIEIIWIFLVCTTFSFPYFYLSSLVGKFPAEDLRSGDMHAAYRSLFCIGSQSVSFSLDQEWIKLHDDAKTYFSEKLFNKYLISGVEYVDNSKKIPVTFIITNRNFKNLVLNNSFIEKEKFSNGVDFYSNYPSAFTSLNSDLYYSFLRSYDFKTPLIYLLITNKPYFSENLYRLQWSLGSLRTITNKSLPSAPVSLNPFFASHLSDTSDSLYFSHENMRIYAQDKIDTIPLSYLWMMQQDRELLGRDLATLYNEAESFYSPCITPIAPRGLTEGYWASKGTSVLHHWAHLYEAIVPGEPKLAQYGYLVPNLAQQITSFQGIAGPTAFVRTAWFIFCILGLFYIVLFFILFSEDIFVACIFLLAQIYVFFLIKQFYLLLAPGYHWFRELVVIALPLLFIILFLPSINKSINIRLNNKLKCFVFFSIVVLCYYLEPSYTLLSITCIIFSYLWCNKLKIFELLFSQKNLNFYVAVFFGLLFSFGLLFGVQKFNYIADKLSNSDFGLFEIFNSYRLKVFFLMFISSIVLFFSESNEKSFRLNYCAVISIFEAMYYFILPDDAHFAKYIEFYIILMLAVYCDMLLILREFYFHVKMNFMYEFMQNGVVRIVLNFQKNIFSGTINARTIKSGAQTVIILIIAVICCNQMIELEYSHPERMHLDVWSGKPYFSSDKITINNRIIDADLSWSVIEHLKSFPDEVKSDFLISSYDKYLLFIYDRRNGFASPDFLSWLNSSKRKDEIQEQILITEKPLTIIFDLNDLEVDSRASLLKGNINFGGLAKASILNIKSRYRMAELMNQLLKYCYLENDQIRTDWAIARCQARE